MSVTVRLTGVREVDAVIRGLPLQLSDRVLQNAAADSAKPLVEREQLLAPEGPTGALVDSIGVVKGRGSLDKRDLGVVVVGPRRRGKYRGYHAHLVEYGTVKRDKKGPNRGRMPARPFVLPAFKQTNAEVISRYNASLSTKLYQFMRRTIKKAA